MFKKNLFKKAVIVGLATVMTVTGSVVAFAGTANFTLSPGSARVNCEIGTSYNGDVERCYVKVSSTSIIDATIYGYGTNVCGNYSFSGGCDQNYSALVTRHSEYGFDSITATCKVSSDDGGDEITDMTVY